MPEHCENCRILITAGPTHEPIDAVRYLANRSSGRMGLAIAQAAAERGLPVTLLLGPTHLHWQGPPNSSQTAVVRFQTTADLQRLLGEHWPQHDVLIMAAAVADFRPVVENVESSQRRSRQTGQSGAGKLRRTGERLTLKLEPTPDLLSDLAATTRADQRVIGFALEPAERLLESAREKLVRKQLDAIVANPLETMDAETVTATLLLRDGSALSAPPAMHKAAFAQWLVDALPQIRAAGAAT